MFPEMYLQTLLQNVELKSEFWQYNAVAFRHKFGCILVNMYVNFVET